MSVTAGSLGEISLRLGSFSLIVFCVLRWMRNIRCYCERPLAEKVHVNGTTFTVKPSVYVVLADGTEMFLLVTTSEDSSTTDNFNLWGVTRNEKIEIIGHKDVYIGQYWMRNISYLAGRSRRIKTCDRGADDAFTRYLSTNGAMSIGQLVDAGRLSEPNANDYIAYLYFKGLINIHDIKERQISYRTEVECR